MNKKKLTTILATLLIAITLVLPMAALPMVMAADPDDYYTTVDGVLASDYYVLYPYAKKDLDIGFSKFGELIGIPVTGDQSDQADWVGLTYDGRDPFCPASVVPMTSWINGWYIDIEYIDPSRDGAQRNRHLYAFAMFADGDVWGKDWQWAKTPHSSPNGGRKTNGSCTTDALKILYDGPRRLVAQSVTHVSDLIVGGTPWPVVDVIITMIFNKVEKQVILLKDIKFKASKTHCPGKMDIEFSNREQYDLGSSPEYRSYVHYYDQTGVTCYGPPWHYAVNLTREFVNHTTATGTTKTFTLQPPKISGTETRYPVANDFLKVWIDGVFQYTDKYSVDWDTNEVTFVVTPGSEAVPVDIEFHYKYIFKQEKAPGPDGVGYDYVPTWNHTYDYAQVISDDAKYVAWTGIWPPASSWTVDGLTTFLDPLTDPSHVNTDDMASEPDQSPLIIAEWDFLMDETLPMFRCVEVKGVTDLHDADDLDMSGEVTGFGSANTLDREAEFQLDEIFMPWDLLNATHKQEYRRLYKKTIPDTIGTTTTVQLTSGLDDDIYYAYRTAELTAAGLTAPGWTGYFIRDSADTAPVDSRWLNNLEDSATNGTAYSKNWFVHLKSGTQHQEELQVTPIAGTPTATAPLTLQLKDLVDWGYWYRVPSGSLPMGPHIEVKVVNTQNPVAGTTDWAVIGMQSVVLGTSTSWTQVTLNTIEQVTNYAGGPDEPFTCWEWGGGLSSPVAKNVGHSWEYFTDPDILGDYYVQYVAVAQPWGTDYTAYVDDLSVAYLDRDSGIRYERVYNMEEDKLVPTDWDDYCSMAERVLVDDVLINRYGYHSYDPIKATSTTHRPYYKINFELGNMTFYEYTTSYVLRDIELCDVKVLYSTIEENEKGRYEWVVVGRDAASVDSVGAALVTAAFKNKDIEIGMAGVDMNDTLVANRIPYVMRKFGTADTYDDYRNTLERAAFRDDWCDTLPVASSNMIFIGGAEPDVNLGAYYFNDFTDAFSDFTGEFTNPTTSPWSGYIIGLSCWNQTLYSSSSATGYAVIATTKDKNGTVGLSIYGHWGRDTYYACKWFHEDGIYQLQEAPDCVTSIILKIRYTDPQHPTCSIVEVLGTITEREWVHDSTTKGGIHDCP